MPWATTREDWLFVAPLELVRMGEWMDGKNGKNGKNRRWRTRLRLIAGVARHIWHVLAGCHVVSGNLERTVIPRAETATDCGSVKEAVE